MDISRFTDKSKTPTDKEVADTLGSRYALWQAIRRFVFEKYPAATEEWSYPGKNYGWSFRIKDKKRAIIYFLPREGYFKVALVFGQKATDQVLQSDVSAAIKDELKNARVYAEGRGIRLDVKEEAEIADVKKLIEIKLAH